MKKLITIPHEIIQQKIYLIRGEKVMFDRDLAEMYGVETGALNRAVKRNKDRFPADFMFQLNKQETEAFSRYHFGTLDKAISLRCQTGILDRDSLRSQFVTLKKGRGQHVKFAPYVFTEQGVAMLSSVLNSKRAIQVNIQIIRTFTQLRKILSTHKELREKMEKLENQVTNDGKKNKKYFVEIFKILGMLMKDDAKPNKNKIGFEIRKK